MTSKVRVNRKEDNISYDVIIGKSLINKVGALIKDNADLNCESFLIITGEMSSRYYVDKIEKSLRDVGYYDIKTIVLGKDKVRDVQGRTPIIVGGNRFHYALQTLKDYIYVPTTLLGMSNNVVMGHPLLAIADINLLNTLEYKYFISGYSEIAKHAIMRDLDFFEWLESHGRSIFDGDENARLHAIKKSCEIKAKFIENSESKKLLGFGHLYGDAISKIAKTNLLHGEAISVGIVAAFKISHKLHLCSVDDYKRVRRHLKSMSLPVELYADYWNPEDIVDTIDVTKPIILPKGIGQVEEFKKELFHRTLMQIANEIISRN